MPLYEFRCPNCQAKREVLQPFGADPPLCDQCSVTMVRLISLPAMVKIENIPIKYKSLGITPFKSWEPGPGET